MAGLLRNARGAITHFTSHWRSPAKGSCVPYKEVAGYSAGMFGYYLAIALVSKIGLDTGNVVIGQALGVEPAHIMLMNVVSTFAGFWFTMLRSHAVDNARGREGRFRPFMKRYGIPTVALAFALVWFPYSALPNRGLSGTGYWMKAGIILLLFLGIRLVWPFYEMGFRDLARVLSPNSQERQNIIAFSSIVWSLAPTIYNPIITTIAGYLPNRGADIELYRKAFIPICVIGLALGYVGYYSTKERIIQSRARVDRISVIQAFQSVSRNKNFWIICLASWVGFLEGASGGIWEWAFTYQERITGEQKALVDLLIGTAGLFAMSLAPYLTRRFGKRAVLIWSNIFNVVLLAVTYNTYNLLIPLSIFRYLNFFLGIMLDTIGPAIDADIRDAQQYLTGERIDGMFGMVNYVGTIIGMGTGFVLPALQKRSGIYAGNGAVDNRGQPNMWFALKKPAVYNRMCRTMIAASVIGAVLNVLPMFWYDITEKKQRAMARVLKLRALLEDYSEGLHTPGQLAEGVEIVRQAREDSDAQPIEITGDMTAKQRLEVRIRNEDMSMAYYVTDELSKFGTPLLRRKAELARQVMEGGFEGLYHCDPALLRAAEALPAGSKEQRELRAMEIGHHRALRRAASSIARCYPDHEITEPDLRACQALYELPEDSRGALRAKNAAIKEMEADRSRFYNACKPWLDARRLLKELENHARLDEIFAQA